MTFQVDYAQAEARPSPNFWAGGDGNKYVVIHATASGEQEYVPDFSNPATQKSTHYAVAKDGHIVQYVREADSAWGNCCAKGASPFVTVPSYNYNKNTISIENEKWSSDNSEPLEPAQYAALLTLVVDICTRQHIPMVYGTPTQPGILFHHDLDPVTRAGCPGTFPYDTFLSDLQKGAPTPTMSIITNNGAVADFRQAYQLDGGSPDKCGPWSAAECKYAGLPGKGPTGSASDVAHWGNAEYVLHIGPDVPSDTGGSSIENMHQFFHDAGNLHYWDISAINPTSQQASDLAHVRGALSAGYPVVVTVNEVSVLSKHLGKCPYPWEPGMGPANHILTIIGVDKDGDFICADTLNNFEPWPAVYRAAPFEMHWASIVGLVGQDAAHPWHKPIPSDEPASWPVGFNAQNFGQVNPPPAPVPPPAPTPPPPYQFTEQEIAVWNSSKTGAPLGTGISIDWSKRWRNIPHRVFGAPLGIEFPVKVGAFIYMYQQFPGGLAHWDEHGVCHWENESGVIV